MKGNVGMLLHEKERKKKQEDAYTIIHNPIEMIFPLVKTSFVMKVCNAWVVTSLCPTG